MVLKPCAKYQGITVFHNLLELRNEMHFFKSLDFWSSNRTDLVNEFVKKFDDSDNIVSPSKEKEKLFAFINFRDEKVILNLFDALNDEKQFSICKYSKSKYILARTIR